jgi:hypothetical protein
MDNELLSVRELEPSEYPMVSAWARAHGCGKFDPRLLPANRFFAVCVDGNPVMVAALHFLVGVGVAMLDHSFSVPGLSLRNARRASAALVDVASDIAAQNNCGVLQMFVPSGIARVAKTLGFQEQDNNLHFMTKQCL